MDEIQYISQVHMHYYQQKLKKTISNAECLILISTIMKATKLESHPRIISGT